MHLSISFSADSGQLLKLFVTSEGFADKPNSVFFRRGGKRQSFILAAHYCDAHATYPFRLSAVRREIERASLYPPKADNETYTVLLSMGFIT